MKTSSKKQSYKMNNTFYLNEKVPFSVLLYVHFFEQNKIKKIAKFKEETQKFERECHRVEIALNK